jgi:hypothetical protein
MQVENFERRSGSWISSESTMSWEQARETSGVVASPPIRLSDRMLAENGLPRKTGGYG